MKKTARYSLILILPFLLLISACAVQKNGTPISIYRAVSPYYLTDGNLVAAQEVPLNPGVGVINNAISAFNSDPGSQTLRSPLPDGAGIIGYTLEGGVLRLETKGCEALTGIDLTVLRCCAVLTFCGINGIDAVSLWSGETELCPPLSIGDIVVSDPSENSESS